MIEVYKILQGKYDTQVSDLLCKQDQILPATANRTRGHSQKLYKRKHRLHIRKHKITFRDVEPWNSLPEKVLSAPTINTFERRLDSLCHNQELKYDFKKCLRITIPNNAPGIAVDDDEHDEPEEN